MNMNLNRLDPLSRRHFMEKVAKTALGVTLLPVGSRAVQAAAGNGPGFGKAKHVIYLFMGGLNAFIIPKRGFEGNAAEAAKRIRELTGK